MGVDIDLAMSMQRSNPFHIEPALSGSISRRLGTPDLGRRQEFATLHDGVL